MKAQAWIDVLDHVPWALLGIDARTCTSTFRAREPSCLVHPHSARPFVPRTWHARLSFGVRSTDGCEASLLPVTRATLADALLRSAIPAQGHGVVSLPHRAPGRSDLAGQVSFLAQAAMLASGRGEAAQFAMFHGGCADPVEPRVLLHRRVRRIHHDHFVELVGGIFVHPVGVEDAQSAAATSSTLFRHAAQVACELELRDALMHRLPIHLSFVHRTLAAATAHAHAVHHDALLGLVSQPTGLVGTRRTRHAHDRRQLAVFPAAHAQQEPQHVALLLPPQLFHVLPGASLPSASRRLASCLFLRSCFASRTLYAPMAHAKARRSCSTCARLVCAMPSSHRFHVQNPLLLPQTLSIPTR